MMEIYTVAIMFIITIPHFSHTVPISIQNGNQQPLVIIPGNNSIFSNNFELLGSTTPDPGCRYKAQSYTKGDEVPTDEPCLRCQCRKRAVVCKLRICTEQMPNAPPPGCVVVQKAKSCCPKLVCTETKKVLREREQRLSTQILKNETNIQIHGMKSLTTSGEGYCIHDGTIYAEGSAMKSDSPCDYCFCIRGEMKCSKPECIIPLNGCKPRYRLLSSCCPTNYDCSDSNTTGAIIQSSSTSTPIPYFLKGCQVLDRFIYEGEPVLPIHLDPDEDGSINVCQSCFCLSGTVRCRPLECRRPIEGCKPITKEGHCCPIRYECNTTFTSGENSIRISENEKRKELQEEPLNVGSSSFSSHVNYLNETKGNDSGIHSNNLKSDIGSREERRNKDKDDLTSSRTSYEDDERDYLFGVDSLDHELIPKITFDDSPKKIKHPPPTPLPSFIKNEVDPGISGRNIQNETTVDESGGSTFQNTTMEEQVAVVPPLILPNEMKSNSSPSFDSNLEFITFGMEDAVGSDFKAPIKITYDKELSSLIPPTPERGYIVSEGSLLNRSHLKEFDDHRNVIMDIPISTSLYNSGYYHHNGIITNSSTYPGKVLDESVEDFLIEITEEPTTEHEDYFTDLRIHSKFHVDDSPSHRITQTNNNQDGEIIHNPGYTKTKHTPEFKVPILYDDSIEIHNNDTFNNEPIRIISNTPTTTTTTTTEQSSKDHQNFKPVVAFPFSITQKPKDFINHGLKLSGCNIYGKMYTIGNIILELSSSCVQCQCTEIGVQCSELPC